LVGYIHDIIQMASYQKAGFMTPQHPFGWLVITSNLRLTLSYLRSSAVFMTVRLTAWCHRLLAGINDLRCRSKAGVAWGSMTCMHCSDACGPARTIGTAVWRWSQS